MFWAGLGAGWFRGLAKATGSWELWALIEGGAIWGRFLAHLSDSIRDSKRLRDFRDE
jgi:hypothetical protein